MRAPLTVGLLVALPFVAAPTSAQALRNADDFIKLEGVLQKAKDKISPSVVTIRTYGGTRGAGKGQPAGRPRGGRPPRGRGRPSLGMKGFAQAQGATTGIVIGEDGWILVSRFALNYNPTTILVSLADGRNFTAKRMGQDLSREIAVVKIDAKDLKVPELVKQKDIQVGQWAFALGRTFGKKEPSVHVGVVSAVRRIFGRAVQVDAYTSPANYGGPIIDVQGRVMGIVVPLAASGRQAGEDLYDSGIGFGASIADILPLIDKMKKGETLYRGLLGVSTKPEFLGPGAKVHRVRRKSPARNAKIRRNDVILEIDGVKVKNGFHLQTLVGSKMAGDPVKIKYRNRKKEVIGVTVFLDKVGADMMKAKGKDEETKKLPWEEFDDENDGGGAAEDRDPPAKKGDDKKGDGSK